MSQGSEVSDARQQLVADFNRVVTDTEALLKAVATVPGEKATALRASVEENLRAAKERVRQLQGAAYERGTAAVRVTDEYVHENAWAAIGVAAAVGLIVGLLIAGERR